MVFAKRKALGGTGNEQAMEQMSNKRLRLQQQDCSIWDKAINSKSVIIKTSKQQFKDIIANTIPEHIDKLCQYGLQGETPPLLESQLHSESLILSQICVVLKLFINIRISELRTDNKETTTTVSLPSQLKSTAEILINTVNDIRTVHSSAHGLLSLLGDSPNSTTTTNDPPAAADHNEDKNTEIAIELLCLYMALLDRLLEIRDLIVL